ncbi:unnamed protein product [Chironomus riparius]|uniref:Gustatory receptor n=1 Tax=Chironomus riparius TaxID=315576 RepID=A0A9N9S7C8_9DIPT|nr:unnamed protein product [Chironomus riparius]
MFVINYDSVVFLSQTTFAELIYSSNDLMFVYYVELLTEYLDFINHKVQMMRTQNDLKTIRRELLEVFKLKRKILERYSIDIFITILFHFVLSITSFYWVIMRLIFNHLKKYYQYATFLHFPEPIFIYYVLFSTCENFYRKLKKVELNLHTKAVKFKKSESIFILLNSIESKFIICGMISMKIETLTDFQFIVQSVTLFATVYFPNFLSPTPWYSGGGIYSVTQVYQSIFPFIIQNFLILKAFLMRNKQKNLAQKLKPKFTQKLGNCEKKFLIRMSFIIIVRIIKYGMASNQSNVIFHSQTAFPELIYSSNDLMFVYYVELLIEYLNYINHKIQMIRTQNDMKIVKREIFEVFVLKAKILDRYSIDIFITIFFHFLLTIISFYWVIMRLIFNYLKYFRQFGTFLHFLVPFFMFWTIFSKCEEFYKKIKEVELNLYMKTTTFKKSESIFILLNSVECKFIVCGMINMKIETLTDMLSEIFNFFIMMVQLFTINPYK